MKALFILFILFLSFYTNLSSVIVEEHHEEEDGHDEEKGHDDYDAFEALLRKTNSQYQDSLTEDALQQVLDAVNENVIL